MIWRCLAFSGLIFGNRWWFGLACAILGLERRGFFGPGYFVGAGQPGPWSLAVPCCRAGLESKRALSIGTRVQSHGSARAGLGARDFLCLQADRASWGQRCGDAISSLLSCAPHMQRVRPTHCFPSRYMAPFWRAGRVPVREEFTVSTQLAGLQASLAADQPEGPREAPASTADQMMQDKPKGLRGAEAFSADDREAPAAVTGTAGQIPEEEQEGAAGASAAAGCAEATAAMTTSATLLGEKAASAGEGPETAGQLVADGQEESTATTAQPMQRGLDARPAAAAAEGRNEAPTLTDIQETAAAADQLLQEGAAAATAADGQEEAAAASAAMLTVEEEAASAAEGPAEAITERRTSSRTVGSSPPRRRTSRTNLAWTRSLQRRVGTRPQR